MKNEIRNRLTDLADRLGDSATFMTSEQLNSLRVPESEIINSEAEDIALSDHVIPGVDRCHVERTPLP